jgi:hypothetical protein
MQESPNISTGKELLHIEVSIDIWHKEVSRDDSREVEKAVLRFGNSGLRLEYSIA